MDCPSGWSAFGSKRTGRAIIGLFLCWCLIKVKSGRKVYRITCKRKSIICTHFRKMINVYALEYIGQQKHEKY